MSADLRESRTESGVLQAELDAAREECQALSDSVVGQEQEIARVHEDLSENEDEMREGMDGLQMTIMSLLELQQTAAEQPAPAAAVLPASMPPPPPVSMPPPPVPVRSAQAVLASPGLRQATTKLRQLSRQDPRGPPAAMLDSPAPAQPAATPAPVASAVGIVAKDTPTGTTRSFFATIA